jgi:hypothetical protein
MYYKVISTSIKPLRATISQEYGKLLLSLNINNHKVNLVKKEIELDISLEFVYDLKSLLKVIFKCQKNEIAMEILNHMLEKEKEMVDSEIFEICLEYDEDVSM